MHFLLTSAVVDGESSTSRPCLFTPGTHWIGGWFDLRAGLDNVEERRFLTLPGLVQPVASRYTDSVGN
jgi:hypothetical protein